MESNEKAVSLEQQLAEAEERGYSRGLKAQIKSKMEEPGVWESPGAAAEPLEPTGFRVLEGRRRSIWELGD